MTIIFITFQSIPFINKVPAEYIAYFTPKRPILIGGLAPNEIHTNARTASFLTARIKSHRWYKKVLKNRDPLVVSLGFRRFETCPVYYMEDHNLRQRMLKYTPENLHCQMSFRGPLAKQGEAFCAYQCTTDHKRINFRIAATGVVLESNKSTHIVKKLKLIGSPASIYKNTAFIKDMFTSSLEVSKFIGAKIQTVSGIRGHIRKVVRHPDGHFRAAFEDKIKMSDIVFCKTWVDVKVPEHYRVVDDRTLKTGIQWFGMKTVGELRHEKKLSVPVKKDSNYRPISERPEKVQFKKLQVPKKITAALPFKNMPKNVTEGRKVLSSHEKLMQQVVLRKTTDERKANMLINASGMIMNMKKRKRKLENQDRLAKRRKEVEKMKERKAYNQKQQKLGF